MEKVKEVCNIVSNLTKKYFDDKTCSYNFGDEYELEEEVRDLVSTLTDQIYEMIEDADREIDAKLEANEQRKLDREEARRIDDYLATYKYYEQI